jgi:hypothetical protein
MKAWLVSVLASAAGVAIGTGITVAEFAPAKEVFVISEDEGTVIMTDASGGTPKAVVEGEKEHNFGVMERNVKGEHVFKVSNQGTAPLSIKVGHTTCKCTVAKLANETLAPGESTEVRLEWEAKSYVEDFRQSAEVETNDPANRVIRLAIAGNIIQSIRPIPEELTLSAISANEDSVAETKIYAFTAKPLEIKQASLVNADYADHFAVTATPLSDKEVAEVANAKSGFRISLNVKSGLPVGPLNQTIRVETNVPTAEVVEIPVHLTVASDISVINASPEASFVSEKNLLRLGKLQSEKGANAQLYLLVKGPHRNDIKLTIASIEPATVIQATLGEATPLRNGAVLRYPLKLTIPPGQSPVSRIGGEQGELGKIILHTTHPIAKEVRLYVQFAIE